MASHYWIKLYHEILEDPKMGQLPDRAWRRAIELFLLAGDANGDGVLPHITAIAWRLRVDEAILLEDLGELAAVGIVGYDEDTDRWQVMNFSKRQAAALPAERMAQYRERQRKVEYYNDYTQTEGNEQGNEESDAPVTKGNADIDIESDKESEIEQDKEKTSPSPDLETAKWIAELESQTPPDRPPPRSEGELRQGIQAASLAYAARMEGEPWLTWGAQSKEALRQFERVLDSADDVRRLGWELEEQFGLVPLWAKPKDVKRWVSELCNCLEVARGDVDVVLAAAAKLRKDKFTVGGPWSLVNTTRALAAERQSAGTSERALRQRYASEGVLT